MLTITSTSSTIFYSMPIMLSARKRKVRKVEGEEAAAPCPPLTPTPPPSLVSHHYLLAGRPADRLPPPPPRNQQFVQGENRGTVRGTAEGLRLDLLQNFRPSIFGFSCC
ncbi:hypothetical protein VPH35_094212 [Triticum aestivum]